MPAPKDPERYTEYIRKLSESHKGKPGPNKGKPQSEELRKKLGDIRRGKRRGPHSAKTRAKIAEANRGRYINTPIEEHGVSSDLFLPCDDEKVCAFCNLIKPHHQFYKSKFSTDGYCPRCRSCYTKTYRANSKQSPANKKLTPELYPEGYKRCAKCREVKPLGEFHSGKNISKVTRCKACSRTTANKNRQNNLRHGYGLTLEEYDTMFNQQEGVCACCGKPENRIRRGQALPLFIDHCHATEAIRGLLCGNCNAALGLMREDPDRVKALLRYIEERCLW